MLFLFILSFFFSLFFLYCLDFYDYIILIYKRSKIEFLRIRYLGHEVVLRGE